MTRSAGLSLSKRQKKKGNSPYAIDCGITTAPTVIAQIISLASQVKLYFGSQWTMGNIPVKYDLIPLGARLTIDRD